MKLYETVEICPYCDRENILQWNTEIMGFVAICQHCGKEIMLCDECMHSEDNESMSCDWCKDCNGCCHRDNRPIVLITRGRYIEEDDNYYELHFSVPKNWLKEYISDKWNSINRFLEVYTLEISSEIYTKALMQEIIISEEEVYCGKDL